MNYYDEIMGKTTNAINKTQNNIKKSIDDSYEVAKKSYVNVKKVYNKLSWLQLLLLIIGILLILIILILIIYFIISERNKKNRLMGGKLFMTEIDNNNLHNSKEIYIYKDNGNQTPYIPNNVIKDINGNQNTYSFWFFIEGQQWNYRYGEWKHIMHRGTNPQMMDDKDIYRLTIQTPGFWLAPTINQLICLYTTSKNNQIRYEKLTIEDLELNRWINITFTLNNNNISLYKNGKLEKIINLKGQMPAIMSNLYINYFGGFAGNMSYLQYFNKVLIPKEIKENYNQYNKKIKRFMNRKNNLINDEDSDKNMFEEIESRIQSKKKCDKICKENQK